MKLRLVNPKSENELDELKSLKLSAVDDCVKCVSTPKCLRELFFIPFSISVFIFISPTEINLMSQFY